MKRCPITLIIRKMQIKITRRYHYIPSAVQCIARSCLTLCNPTDYNLPGSSVHGIFQARNTGVDCHFLLQGIFLAQGLNLHLLHWQADSHTH